MLPDPNRNGNPGTGDSDMAAWASLFGVPRPISQLKRYEEDARWVWRGYLARGAITLLSALWKVGKTTLLAHLVRELAEAGEFCGTSVAPARVLYVTEEHEGLWAERVAELGLADHVEFLVRPFGVKPDLAGWYQFVAYLVKLTRERHYDLVVLDTISDLWPVRDENDNAKVQEAMQPLKRVAQDAALLLVHHLRKSDGTEFTASRGAGALSAIADILVELRSYRPDDDEDRRRVLKGKGRFRETPFERVIELTRPIIKEDDGTYTVMDPGQYVAYGDRKQVRSDDLTRAILGVLPDSPPGLTADEVLERWPEDRGVRRQHFLAALRRGVDAGDWGYTGGTKRGDPCRYFLAEAASRA